MAAMAPGLLDKARAAKGFMPDDEGLALFEAASSVARPDLPLLEVGTYCGKSALYLGAGAAQRGAVLVTIDHHRGSEEQQDGWEHHDREVVDPLTGRMDSLPFARRAIVDAGLEHSVVLVVGDSPAVAAFWSSPLSLLFIDGGHAEDVARADYDAWAHHVAPGGLLAIHDVFPDPRAGGQAPYHVYLQALDDGFIEHSVTGSLRVLVRG